MVYSHGVKEPVSNSFQQLGDHSWGASIYKQHLSQGRHSFFLKIIRLLHSYFF